jgi:hypothetical protein
LQIIDFFRRQRGGSPAPVDGQSVHDREEIVDRLDLSLELDDLADALGPLKM